MRIGELASRTGVSVRALRYYEEQGLLVAERSASGQRHYPDGAVDRVNLIQQLYAAGLSSRTIVDLLPCVIDGNATPGAARPAVGGTGPDRRHDRGAGRHQEPAGVRHHRRNAQPAHRSAV